MSKEEAWLVWMNATKTTDTPIETDFNVITKTSWWAAFSAGWDAASVNVNGWDDAYKMGVEAGEEKHWIGLTDEEIKEIVGPWGDTPIKGYTRKLFDQIEAKLKEKNT